ncbi:MAG: hypothetical protein ACLQOZ_01830, partial [Acidimicrobiales bacterium]
EVVVTFGAETPVEGGSWWGGVITGLSESDLIELIAEALELRFPDGRVGKGRLEGTAGKFVGWAEAPFD